MIRLALAFLVLIASLISAASAQERVTVGTMRQVSSGPLFLAEAQGYFTAEGLDVDMTAYSSERDVAAAVAAGATDFGLAGFTPVAFNYAGRGLIKAIAGQTAERRGVEGNVLVASSGAYVNGLQAFENLANKAVAIDQLGSPFHYQLAQIARIKRFDFNSLTLKTMQSSDAAARAVAAGAVDAALLPLPYARELLTSNQARFIGWYSELDEQQLGALFVSAKVLAAKRETVTKFVRAYRRGVSDYMMMLKLDHGKRVSTPQSREVATLIARYVYPGMPPARSTPTVEAAAYYIDPQARIDAGDLARQIEWFKAQGLIDAKVDAKAMVDTNFSK